MGKRPLARDDHQLAGADHVNPNRDREGADDATLTAELQPASPALTPHRQILPNGDSNTETGDSLGIGPAESSPIGSPSDRIVFSGIEDPNTLHRGQIRDRAVIMRTVQRERMDACANLSATDVRCD